MIVSGKKERPGAGEGQAEKVRVNFARIIGERNICLILKWIGNVYRQTKVSNAVDRLNQIVDIGNVRPVVATL